MSTALQITMFREFNYGSALQTYAMQTIIERLGYDCRTVDYPNQASSRPRFSLRLSSFRKWISYLRTWIRLYRKYNNFIKAELHLTRPYYSSEEIGSFEPPANLYITGSDQTFNPMFIHDDPAYLLGFVSKNRDITARKISYASSFAISKIPREHEDFYKKYLADYDAISTREESGVRIVQRLLKRDDAVRCCDPTLLLSRKDWVGLADKSKVSLPSGKYILVYILTYMVDPYPDMYSFIEEAQQKTGFRVVFLCGRPRDKKIQNSISINNASPYDFVELFLNASFIITSSFHGTVFSLHSGVPFASCVNSNKDTDSRVSNLLRCICGSHHEVTIPMSRAVKFGDISNWATTDRELAMIDKERGRSLSWLSDAMRGTISNTEVRV